MPYYQYVLGKMCLWIVTRKRQKVSLWSEPYFPTKPCLKYGLILHIFTSVNTAVWEVLHCNCFRTNETFFTHPFVATNQPLLLIWSPMGLLTSTTWRTKAKILQVNKMFGFKISFDKTNSSLYFVNKQSTQVSVNIVDNLHNNNMIAQQ